MFYDCKTQFDMMTDAQIGRLMRMIVDHVNGEEPDLDGCPLAVKLLYSVMVQSVDRGTERMELSSVKRSEAAKEREKNKKARSAAACQNVPRAAQTETETKTETKPKAGDKTVSSEKTLSLKEATPTLEEVTAYCRERGNTIDPKIFIDYYASCGWMKGSSRISDWRALVRVWEKRENTGDKQKPAPLTERASSPSYDIAAINNGVFDKYRKFAETQQSALQSP